MKNCFLFLLFFPGRLCFAQSGNYCISHFNTDNGLPQSSVTCINFDRQGYCWLGTEMGVVRFDGRNFKVFDKRDIPGLASERIRASVSDKDKNIFLLNGVGQAIAISDDDSFRASVPALITEPGFRVPGLPPLQSSVISGKTGTTPVTVHDSMLIYRQAFLQGNGMRYLVAWDKLYYDSGVELEHIHTSSGFWNNQWLIIGEYFILMNNPRHWKTWKNGEPVKTPIEISGPLSTDENLINGKFSCMSENGNYVYAGTTLYHVKIENGVLTSRIALKNLSVPILSVVYYHPDQHKYFIGSLVSGLYIVSASGFQYPKQADDAVLGGFFAQAVTRSGDVICERYLYKRNGGGYQKLNTADRTGASVYLSDSRFLYYGENAMLRSYDLITGKDQKLYDLDSRAASIYADARDSTTILVTTSGSFLKIKNRKLTDSRKLPVRTNNIMSSVQAGRDTFLLATQYGMKWYDFSGNKIFRSVLDSFTIRAIYPEHGGRIWISTYGAGYYLYDNQKIYTMPVGPFPALRTVHSFVEDAAGFLWMPTNNGLFKVRKEDLLDYIRGEVTDPYFYVYTVADNLRTNEFNGGATPSYVWLDKNLLSLPSIQGLVQFDPLTLPVDLPANKIYVDEVIIGDSVADLSASGKMILPADAPRFSIRTTTPYFGNRDNLRIVYSVEGIDTSWQPLPDDGYIRFNLLPSGDYVLRIKKLNGQQASNYDVFSFRFSVLPSFYQTWSFYLLMLALLILLVFLFIRVRTRLLVLRNKRLKEVIQAQTRDLADTVDRLQVSESDLLKSNRMKDMVNTLVLHDLRSPIRFLHTMLNTLSQRHADMPKEQMGQYLTMLEVSTASLNDFTQRFFTWAGSQHKDFIISVSEFDLGALFAELHELYGPIATLSGNRLEADDVDLIVTGDRNILSVIIRNLLDNACKHTRKGTIRLSAGKKENVVLVSVADTGMGFSAEAIEAFHDSTRLPGDNGNGSLIMQDLLGKIGASIDITSGSSGAVCTIRLNAKPTRAGGQDHPVQAKM